VTYCLVHFCSRYRLLCHNASQSRIGTFFLLLDLMQFFDLYHANQLDTALDVSEHTSNDIAVIGGGGSDDDDDADDDDDDINIKCHL